MPEQSEPNRAEPAFTPSLILSFDVEEHHRIEAAAGMRVEPELRFEYASRMEESTRRLLDRLAGTGTQATFYIVGEIARTHPRLVFDIAYAGHEIGAHSWDHRRVHRFDRRGFAEDARITKYALEQASGMPVFGYRAPTFSITAETGWAIDVLAECGYAYDSSIYPVRHDRYGIPTAPRCPFLAVGPEGNTLLELPPVTYRMLGQNLPVAGGGYFRLFPLWVTTRSLARMMATTDPPVAMMYLHPWEFDVDQPRLALRRMAKWRTYVGIKSSAAKLDSLLTTCYFRRAIDVVTELHEMRSALPRFDVGASPRVLATRLPRPEAVLER